MAIKENLEIYQNKIKNMETKLGYIPGRVKLLAVTKTKPVKDILEAYDSGLRCFGENKVQEAAGKIDLLPNDIELHLIGHLQSNKVNKACSIFSCIQSVDSLKIAKLINKKCEEIDKIMDIYLDVNISGEDTKTGINPNEIVNIVEEVIKLKNINLLGLMAIGPNTENKDYIKEKFIEVRDLQSKINLIFSLELKELSMGMSLDFIEAIEAGSTMVRLGSCIFGER